MVVQVDLARWEQGVLVHLEYPPGVVAPEPYVLDWQSDITANDMCIAW